VGGHEIITFEPEYPTVFSPEIPPPNLLSRTHSFAYVKPLPYYQAVGESQSRPLTKRREVNLRWRYFNAVCQKVLPPLQLSVKEISDSFEITKASSDVHDIASVGIRGVGLQGSGLVEETQILAGPAWKPLPTPRRAREGPEGNITQPPHNPFNSSLPTRWLRKRYQRVLGKVPILTYSYQKQPDESPHHHTVGRYEITLAPSAISPHIRYGAHRLPPVDDSSLSWIKHAEKNDGKQKQNDNK
jgi:hypothetical protein